jgi:cytochrome b561
MLKIKPDYYLRFLLVSLLLIMLAISVVGVAVSSVVANDNSHFTLFQAENPSAGPTAVIASDCPGSGSQSSCGG